MSLKREIRELFAKNKIDTVLDKLVSYAENIEDEDFQNEILLLSNQYVSWKEKERKGKVDSEVSLNRIRDAILSKINEVAVNIPPTTSETEKDGNAGDMISQISAFFKVNEEAAILIFHLADSSFRWRNESTLSNRTGWPIDKINAVANRYPHFFKRSRNKKQNTIYQIKNEFYQEAQKIVGR